MIYKAPTSIKNQGARSGAISCFLLQGPLLPEILKIYLYLFSTLCCKKPDHYD